MDRLDMWRDRDWVLETSLSVASAAGRLGEGLRPKQPLFSFLSRGPHPESPYLVVGQVSGLRVQIYAARRDVRHSWRSTLRAELVPTSTGSALRGTFSYSGFVRIFGALWLSTVLVVSLIATVAAAVLMVDGRTHNGLSSLLVAGFLAGMFVLGSVVMDFGNRLGRADEAYLREWVKSRIADE